MDEAALERICEPFFTPRIYSLPCHASLKCCCTEGHRRVRN
jgi:hypothetical protein